MAMEDVKPRVLRWLEELKLASEKVENPKADLHLLVEFPRETGQKLDLIFPREEDLLLIGCAIPVPEEHQALMEKLKPRERDAIIWDFRYSFSFMSVGFNLYHPEGILKRFTVSTGIYADGLTKDAFVRALTDIHKTKILGIWIMERRFGYTPPRGADKTPSTDMYV